LNKLVYPKFMRYPGISTVELTRISSYLLHEGFLYQVTLSPNNA